MPRHRRPQVKKSSNTAANHPLKRGSMKGSPFATKMSSATLGLSAPASVGYNRPDPNMRFSQKKLFNGQYALTVSGTLNMAQIVGATSGQGGFTDLSGSVQAMFIQPDAIIYYSNFLLYLSSAFSKYKFNKIGFRYCGVGSTSDGTRCIFTYTDDPGHPLFFNTSGTTLANLFSPILQSADIVEFAPWSSWSKSYPVDPDKSAYFIADNYPSATGTVYARQVMQGVALCATIGTTASVFGTIFLDFEIDLWDATPQPLASITLKYIISDGHLFEIIKNYCQKFNLDKDELIDRLQRSLLPPLEGSINATPISTSINTVNRVNEVPDSGFTLLKSPQLSTQRR
jgi:hypothetical protein